MRTIYKYPLEVSGTQVIEAPIEKILDIQIQNGRPCLWAVVNTDTPVYHLVVHCFMTGEKDPPVDKLNYISTTQVGDYVLHWFTSYERCLNGE